jgi:Na+/H+ antiporter NhaD/arsenite permease-like protein
MLHWPAPPGYEKLFRIQSAKNDDHRVSVFLRFLCEKCCMNDNENLASPNAFSWVTLVVFFVAIALVIRPVRFRVPCCGRKFSVVVGFVLAPILAVVLLAAITALPGDVILSGLRGSGLLQPYSIIILFFSLSYMSVSLDVTGLLEWIALTFCKRAGTSGRRLFAVLFVIESLATVVLSNDVVVMTLTPILLYICDYVNADALPFLIAEFFAANVWSSLLYVGNPTNIITAQTLGLNFAEYTQWCGLPTLAAGLTLFGCLCAVFGRQIPVVITAPTFETSRLIRNRTSAVIGSILMVGSLAALAGVSFTSVPVWTATLPFALVMVLTDSITDLIQAPKQLQRHETLIDAGDREFESFRRDESIEGGASDDDDDREKKETTEVEFDSFPTPPIEANDDDVTSLPPFVERQWLRFRARMPVLSAVLARQPWALLPFIFSMFILVEALSYHGWTDVFAYGIAQPITGATSASFFVGVLAVVGSNIVNNQPLAILLSRVMTSSQFVVSASSLRASFFALALGANYGANVTIFGALAGIMWRDILVSKGVTNINYCVFLKYGLLITPFVLCAACAVLALEFYISSG